MEALPVEETHRFHCYIPLYSFQVSASPLSGLDSKFSTFDVLPNRSLFSFESCSISDYIACIYEGDGLWYVVQISKIDKANQLVQLVSFRLTESTDFEKGINRPMIKR